MSVSGSPAPISPESRIRPLQDLVVSACGLFTTLVTAGALAYVELRWGFSLYSWTFWFVVPVGALLAGFAGATGYYAGAKFFGHRPSRLLLLNILLVSIATFFLIHYIEYWSMEVDGKRVRDYISFFQYLDLSIRSASMEFRIKAAKIGSTGEMGAFGYIPAILQILGFAAGGVAVHIWLANEPYCDRCSRYFGGKVVQNRFTGDAEAFKAFATRMYELFGTSDLKASIDEHARHGRIERETDDHLHSSIEVRRCKTCDKHWFRFVVERWDGNNWKEIPGLTYAVYCETPLALPG